MSTSSVLPWMSTVELLAYIGNQKAKGLQDEVVLLLVLFGLFICVREAACLTETHVVTGLHLIDTSGSHCGC